ncbi:MAG: DUF302 domain-containing protein [Terriglobales bacterium]
MIYSKQSDRTVEELDRRLRDSAKRHDFGILNVLDLRETLKSKGIDFDRDCRIYDLCNPQAASRALRTDLRLSTILPCRISMFSDATGTTIATVKPTDLLHATGLNFAGAFAEVEGDILAIIDETAGVVAPEGEDQEIEPPPTDFVDNDPSLLHVDPLNRTEVERFERLDEAELACGMLRANGIACELSPPALPGLPSDILLWVNNQDAKLAWALLADADASGQGTDAA